MLPFFHQEASRCNVSKKYNLELKKKPFLLEEEEHCQWHIKHISHDTLLKILFVLEKVSIRRLEELYHYFFWIPSTLTLHEAGRRILTSPSKEKSSVAFSLFA